MSRTVRARAIAVVLAFAAAGCQDYNFNPVGHCLLQPGSQRFTLSNISSADVLFVVDDSGSMAGEQDRLAFAFADFVENLTSTNVARAKGGLLPLDFHVAVTTTSIFYNREPLGAQTCSSTCGIESGKLTCCTGTAPVYGPRKCSAAGPATQCPVAGRPPAGTPATASRASSTAAPRTARTRRTPSTRSAAIRCAARRRASPAGSSRPTTHFAGMCDPATKGVAFDELPFPDGDFVGSAVTTTPSANPRVLHFDKRLYYTWDPDHAELRAERPGLHDGRAQGVLPSRT